MEDDPGRVVHFLVADALEALMPLVDAWAEDVASRPRRRDQLMYLEGYQSGTRAMAAEVKDQLMERILRLRHGMPA